MPMIALNVGGLLLALGIVAFFAPTVFAEHGDPYAKTSLIPSAIGLLIELCGAMSLTRPALRKHCMHLAAMVGLFGIIGGFVPAFRANFDFSKASVIVGLIMSAICLVFVVLCVRSFIAARKARQSMGA
jgi:hypothetical protein